MIKNLLFKKNMLPIYLIFNVTYRCNSRCITCFAWQDINDSDIKKELSVPEIKSISSSLKKIEWVLLTGGEPFLRDEIDDICNIFYTQNDTRRITIPTNCLIPELIVQKTKSILKKCPDINLVLSLSIDGVGEVHDKIRGVKGNFEKLMSTYVQLNALKKQHKNLSINLNTVLFNVNINKIGELMNYVSENMPDVDFHGFELLRGLPRDSELKTPTWQEYEKVLKQIKIYWKRFKFYKMPLAKLIKSAKILGRDIELESLKKQKRVIPCHAGSVSGVIGAFGEVGLCELLPRVGNLRETDYNFKKIWFSDKAEQQRIAIKKRADICKNCTHSCFVASTLLTDPFMYPRLIRYMFEY